MRGREQIDAFNNTKQGHRNNHQKAFTTSRTSKRGIRTRDEVLTLAPVTCKVEGGAKWIRDAGGGLKDVRSRIRRKGEVDEAGVRSKPRQRGEKLFNHTMATSSSTTAGVKTFEVDQNLYKSDTIIYDG
jgi:hypothetical protein